MGIAGSEVVMSHGFDYGVIAVSFVVVDMIVQPTGRAFRAEISADVLKVGVILNGSGSLMPFDEVSIEDPILQLVEIAIRHLMGFQEFSVIVLEDNLESLEIAVILIRLLLFRLDDPKMKPPGMRRRNIHHVPQKRIHGFCNSKIPDILVVEHFSRIDGAEFIGKLFAAEVSGLEEIAVVEFKPHASLPVNVAVAVIGLTEAIADVVVHDPFVYKRAMPVKCTSGSFIAFGNLGIPIPQANRMI